jgi:hypothetical protein
MFEKIARSPKLTDSSCKFQANFNQYHISGSKLLAEIVSVSWPKIFKTENVGLSSCKKKNPALRDNPPLQNIILKKILFLSCILFFLHRIHKPDLIRLNNL